jgi:hypothetical protein
LNMRYDIVINLTLACHDEGIINENTITKGPTVVVQWSLLKIKNSAQWWYR